jgi:hypothetical protein
LPSHPVGWPQVSPDQLLPQRQVWLPPSGTQVAPFWQSFLLRLHPVGLLQVPPIQPSSQLQMQSSYDDVRLPCEPQFRVHGPVSHVDPFQPLSHWHVQGCVSED